MVRVLMLSVKLSRVGCTLNLPSSLALFSSGTKLELDAINAVDTVDEQDQDEDKGYLVCCQLGGSFNKLVYLTFIPYCNFATNGFSEMKLNNLLFQVKGIGMINVMKRTISKTRRRNTCQVV